MKTTFAGGLEYLSVEPECGWLNAKGFWLLAAVCAAVLGTALAGYAVHVAHQEPPTQEMFLYGRTRLAPGTGADVVALVRDGLDGSPIEGADVALTATDPSGRAWWTSRATTGDDGMAHVRLAVPPDAVEGLHVLDARAASAEGAAAISRSLYVSRALRVLVATDKPLYQSGQTIHLRAVALASNDLKPVSGRDLRFEVLDPGGTRVFSSTVATSRFGIAHADFALAPQVNEGAYTVRAVLDGAVTERRVTVACYRLPAFMVAVETDRPFYAPGDTVRCEVRAAYPFGTPVAGGTIAGSLCEPGDAQRPLGTAGGTLDGEGRFTCELPLPRTFAGQDLHRGDVRLSLEASVTDTAGRTHAGRADVTVTAAPLRIEAFPESGALVNRVPNTVYIVTAYADGTPARTRLTIDPGGRAAETGATGVAAITVTPDSRATALTITAEDAGGLRARVTRRLDVDSHASAFRLRTDRAVYAAGSTVEVTCLSAGARGRVFLELVKGESTVLTTAIDLAAPEPRAAFTLAPDLFGTLEIHGYRVLRNGDMVTGARVIQVVRPEGLRIDASTDKDTYRPAEKAVMSLAVTRADGTPCEAALGLAAVDEALFALADMQPSLLQVYFLLHQELFAPRRELLARLPLNAKNAVRDASPPPDTQEARDAAAALFALAEGTPMPPRARSETIQELRERFTERKERTFGHLRAAGFLLPSAFFLLALLPLAVYGAWRWALRRTVAMPAEEDAAALRKTMRQLLMAWTACLYVGINGPLVAQHAGGWTAYALLACLPGILLLALAARAVRANPVACAAPVFRGLVGLLPGTAVLGLIAAAALAIGRQDLVQTAGFHLVDAAIVLSAAALASGVILCASGASLARALSPMAFLFRGLAYAALAVTPLFLLLCVLSPARFGGGRLHHLPEPMAALEAAAPTAPAGEIDAAPPVRTRRHFPETLLWLPELVTDAEGTARVELECPDAITTWRVSMNAVSAAGELGAADLSLRVFQEFFAHIDLPPGLTQHDRVRVPLVLYNWRDTPLAVRVEIEERPWFRLEGPPEVTIDVPARTVASVPIALEALAAGTHELRITAAGGQAADAVECTVRVAPDGLPVGAHVSGVLGAGVTHDITIPDEAIDGATDLLIKLHPGGPLSQVIEGLENVFRLPAGCFEQTTSITYPAVLALDYLTRTGLVKPEVERRARRTIGTGYQQLLTFEVEGGGFEWFSRAPADPVLTAYALMALTDMARVHDVDPAVLARTARLLLDTRRDDGTWAPAARDAADAETASQADRVLRTTATVAWALAEAGADAARLHAPLECIARSATGCTDAYVAALCANALVAGRHPDASRVLERLADLRTTDGDVTRWTSTGQGVTFALGRALDVETTALAAYAFLKAGAGHDIVPGALAYLVGAKDPEGTWHSTQATVLALRALCAAATLSLYSGTVTIAVNGTAIKELVLTPDQREVLHLVSAREHVRKGINRIALEADGPAGAAYQIVATHYVPWDVVKPPVARDITIDAAFDTTAAQAGDTITCRVDAAYHGDGAARMVIIDLGVPPGFTVIPDAFQKLLEEGRIARHAITDSQVILYLDALAKESPLSFAWRLRARHPLRVKTPVSRVYTYYAPDLSASTTPVLIDVE